MSKKWETVYTNANTNKTSKVAQAAADKTYGRMIKSIKGHKIAANLKSESDQAFVDKQTREDNIVAAFEAKKLKSEALIKEAQAIMADREKRNKKKKNEKETADVAKN